MSIEFRSIGSVQCKLTKECKNTACIFKLRDCYDFPVFWYSTRGGKESSCEKQNRILKELGLDDVIYPKFIANVGTNIIDVNCEDKLWK